MGRNREISFFQELLETTATKRVGRLVAVTGEAGAGKTRILNEILGRCGGRIEGYMLSQPSGSEAFPLILWRRLLIQIGRATPATDPFQLGRQARTLEERLESQLRSGSSPHPLTTLLSEIADLVAAVAEQHPLALLFDDVHRSDPASLQIFEFLADALSRLPLTIVMALREKNDSDQQSASLLGRLLRRSERIQLNMLEVDDIEKLQRMVDPAADPSRSRSLQRLSGGNRSSFGNCSKAPASKTNHPRASGLSSRRGSQRFRPR